MLLDGSLASTFGLIFGSFYRPGVLHRVTFTDDGGGGLTQNDDGIVIQIQVDEASMAMRGDDGFASTDVRLIILTDGVIDQLPDGRLNDDDELTATDTGERYKLYGPVLSPTRTHWIARGKLKR